jgi:hypothetical protein
LPCDVGSRAPVRQHLRLSRRQRRRRVPTNVRSTCPSGVLRHLVTRKHVRDTSVRRRVAGRHYPIHRRRCDTLQHRRFHTGSVRIRGSNPLSSTTKDQLRATFQRSVGNDVTSGVVASIHAQKNRAGNAYRVLWRHDGRQRSLTFENLPAAAPVPVVWGSTPTTRVARTGKPSRGA